MSIVLRSPCPDDEAAFLQAVSDSRELHHPWVSPPHTPAKFLDYLDKYSDERNECFLVVEASGGLVGCIHINEIVRGRFRSGYLGYYGFVPYAGKGLMKQAMVLAIGEGFGRLQLHRLEANIRPENEASIRLVHSLGFRHEGFSPRYLFLEGQWRDHERYAITVEDWA